MQYLGILMTLFIITGLICALWLLLHLCRLFPCHSHAVKIFISLVASVRAIPVASFHEWVLRLDRKSIQRLQNLNHWSPGRQSQRSQLRFWMVKSSLLRLSRLRVKTHAAHCLCPPSHRFQSAIFLNRTSQRFQDIPISVMTFW